ncbi:DUF4065 domain-containing protein [Paeniclostridium sordellii]|nr:DUF4065 domain-containing protein [Paeniclostridium sordellii]
MNKSQFIWLLFIYSSIFNIKNNLKYITGLRYVIYTFGSIIEGKNYELILNLDTEFEKEVKDVKYNVITKFNSKNNYDLSLFTGSEIGIIDKVIGLFKNKLKLV